MPPVSWVARTARKNSSAAARCRRKARCRSRRRTPATACTFVAASLPREDMFRGLYISRTYPLEAGRLPQRCKLCRGVAHGHPRADHGALPHQHSAQVAPVLYDTCMLAARRPCIMELPRTRNEHGAQATGSGVRAVQAFATRQALVRAVRDGPAARSGAVQDRRRARVRYRRAGLI